jgi:hypothetical protein
MIWIFWVLLGCSSGGQAEFDAGVLATRGGDQVKAATLLVESLDAGARHPATYHGLGNALYRSGHLGEAIAAWQRGLYLAPRNGDIASNLARAQRQTQDQLQAPRSHREAFFWAEALSPRETGLLASSAMSAGLVIAVVARIRRTRSGLTQPRRTATWTWVLLGLSLLLGGSTWDTISQRSGAVVIVPQVAARSTLGPDGVDLFVLHEGAQVRVGDSAAAHTLITLSDGRVGWVGSQTLISTDPSASFPLKSTQD